METTVGPILGTAAFGLLILVTVGVIYLTLSGWRDRRRQEQDRRRRWAVDQQAIIAIFLFRTKL